MEDSNRFGAFLMGLGFGTAIGLLLAPKSGSDARDYLQSKSREIANRLKSGGHSLYDRAKDGVQSGKQHVQDRVKNLSNAADARRLAFRKAVGETWHVTKAKWSTRPEIVEDAETPGVRL